MPSMRAPPTEPLTNLGANQLVANEIHDHLMWQQMPASQLFPPQLDRHHEQRVDDVGDGLRALSDCTRDDGGGG